jgi:hypothetical protein
MTIVRDIAVPEMQTREPYGAINGALAAPGIVARVLPPAAALLWSAANSYDAVLMAAVIGSALVVASFWLAVTGTGSKSAIITKSAS